jgi:hypothetical protein
MVSTAVVSNCRKTECAFKPRIFVCSLFFETFVKVMSREIQLEKALSLSSRLSSFVILAAMGIKTRSRKIVMHMKSDALKSIEIKDRDIMNTNNFRKHSMQE